MNKRSDVTEQFEVQMALDEQRALEHALAQALAPVHEPSASFVEALEQELVLEAERQHAKQQLLQTLGIVGGGVLTIVAGVVGYVLLRRQQKEKPAEVENVEVKESATSEPVPVLAG